MAANDVDLEVLLGWVPQPEGFQLTVLCNALGDRDDDRYFGQHLVQLDTLADLRFMEISVRADADDAPRVQSDVEKAVCEAGLTIAPLAATKTDAVLRRLVPQRWGPTPTPGTGDLQ